MAPKPHLVRHSHTLYRVAPRSWADPLDASYSMTVEDNRWNTTDFPALYCCCSIHVAAENVRDRLRRLSLILDDLQDGQLPTLVSIRWSGSLVDCASTKGLAAAGLPDAYPAGTSKADCRVLAAAWHAAGLQGVLARSAAVWRNGTHGDWRGDHQRWSEAAIFVWNCPHKPKMIHRRKDLYWVRRIP